MKSKNGFTMVEVIIVVAIIAVLASIIMPKFTGARNKAKLTACKANIRQIATAMELYAAANNGKYTPCATSSLTYYTGCYYLVPEYMKTAPLCSTGHTYDIAANHPGLRSAPAGCILVYSMCYSAPHSLPDFCPYYWVGGSIREN